MHSNWLKIEWVKNFSYFFVIHYSVTAGTAILSAENSETCGRSGFASNPTGQLTALPRPVMWSETSVLEQDKSETKKSRSWSWSCKFCVVLWIVTFVVIMILEDVSFLYFVLGISLLWRSTVTFTYLTVKSAKRLCLLPVVLVLFCRGLGLGLVILVLVLRIGLVYITARPPSW